MCLPFTQAEDSVYHFMAIALCMAYNLSMFHQLITPAAVLCISPPLFSDFVIVADTGSSYEIGRQGLVGPSCCLFFSLTPQIVSTLCSAYKVLCSELRVFPMVSSGSSHQGFLETLQLVNSIWFHAILSLCKFLSITSLPFPVAPCCWFGWSPDMDLLRCKWVQAEWGSIWKERWVDCLCVTVWYGQWRH